MILVWTHFKPCTWPCCRGRRFQPLSSVESQIHSTIADSGKRWTFKTGSDIRGPEPCAFVLGRVPPPRTDKPVGRGRQQAHTEILRNAHERLFVAQSIGRRDGHLVPESTRDTQTISFNSKISRRGWFPRAALLARWPRPGCFDWHGQGTSRLSKPAWSCHRASRNSCRNWPRTTSCSSGSEGTPSVICLRRNPCFLLTDHLPMPKKSFNSLERLGAERIALGPKMLFASQCVVLIHNELDLAQA